MAMLPWTGLHLQGCMSVLGRHLEFSHPCVHCRLYVSPYGIDQRLVLALDALRGCCQTQKAALELTDGEVIVMRCQLLRRHFSSALEKADSQPVAADYLRSKLSVLEFAVSSIPVKD